MIHCAALSTENEATNRQVESKRDPLSESLTQETAPKFFRILREKGYAQVAAWLGWEEEELRLRLADYIKRQLKAEQGITVTWAQDAVPATDSYSYPPVIFQLSDLLNTFVLESGLFLEWHWWCFDVQSPKVRKHRTDLRDLTYAYLDQAKLLLHQAVKKAETDHHLVHIQEVYTTFCMTILQLVETMYDFPLKMDSETRPNVIDFELHGHFAGLRDSPYLFEETKACLKGSAGSVRLHRCLPLDTDRRGRDVSFEELANIYRTSRVTVSNVFKKIQKQMRRKIKVSKWDFDGTFR